MANETPPEIYVIWNIVRNVGAGVVCSILCQEKQTSSVEDNIQMVEVRQSFRHGSHFYVR